MRLAPKIPSSNILLGLMLVTPLAACSPATPNATTRVPAAERDPGYSATDAVIAQMGADGLPRYRLEADRIEQDPQSLKVSLQALRFETCARDGAPWQVRAPDGLLSADARRLDLSGGVTVSTESKALGNGRLQLVTDRLQYDLESSRMRAPGAVKVSLQGHELAATGLDANLRTRQLRLQSAIRGRFKP
ncbi:MAG: LPS export ABC transporter periplasmic protein LptC [Gammaproteobacteria bacterium]|nr:LPS export ABC transporter periplasmic protein LptC [Gammaproteobacteria bacterium]